MKSRQRAIIAFLCVLYLGVAFYLAFFMRESQGIIFTSENREIWLNEKVSFVPFRTIQLYGNSMFTSNWKWAASNFFGNLIGFMPLALFIPCFIPKTRQRKHFFIAMLVFITIIEASQLIFMCGAFDIDDYIFNISGAWIVYELLFHSQAFSGDFKKRLGICTEENGENRENQKQKK